MCGNKKTYTEFRIDITKEIIIMSTISGTWDDIKLVCTNRHEIPVDMIIQQGPSSLFFACPKFDANNCEPGEQRCNNRLNLVDHERMIDHLDTMRFEAEMNNEKPILKNHKWDTAKGIQYVVLSHEGDKMVVGMYNKRAINS